MGLGVILIFNFIYQHSSKSELGNIFVSLGRAIMKRTLIAGFSQIILIISLACFSCETQKMPASLLSLFFFSCVHANSDHGPRRSKRTWKLGIRIATCHGAMLYFVKKA